MKHETDRCTGLPWFRRLVFGLQVIYCGSWLFSAFVAYTTWQVELADYPVFLKSCMYALARVMSTVGSNLDVGTCVGSRTLSLIPCT